MTYTDWRSGMLKWFGTSWRAPINESCPQAPTPVGEPCMECMEPIRKDAQGFLMMDIDAYAPLHRTCMMEMTLGPDWRQVIPQPLLDELEASVGSECKVIQP